MSLRTIEVFADISCPFTHVGLGVVVAKVADVDPDVEIRVRAWPLEWVNGVGLDASSTAEKIDKLRAQLGNSYFAGFRVDSWPQTTIPALNLAAEAYAIGPAKGLKVSLELRALLFEQGIDISDLDVLAEVSDRHHLSDVGPEPHLHVVADYEEGQSRSVKGSPHFWVDDKNFFCPSLRVGHEPSGALTASFDPAGLADFMSNIDPGRSSAL